MGTVRKNMQSEDGIYQRANGRWQVKIRKTGFPSRSKTFQFKKDAVVWARAVKSRMDLGDYVPPDDSQKTTFGAVGQRYIDEVLPSKRGQVQSTYLLKSLIKTFGSYSLASLTPAVLSAHKLERLKSVGPQTVAHELSMISRVFKAASVDWGIQLPRGIPTVRKPDLPNGRTRRLEPGEEALILATLTKCCIFSPRAAFVLALETAGRQSELCALKWEDVDLINKTVLLRGKDGGVTKNGEDFREVPLSTRALALLSEIPREARGKVLLLSSNALKLAWQRALATARRTHIHGLLCEQLAANGLNKDERAAQIRAVIYKKKVPLPLTIQILAELDSTDKTLLDLHFHDLRHEATSRMAAWFGMHQLMKVTGHKSSKMVMRYYHPRATDLAALMG